MRSIAYNKKAGEMQFTDLGDSTHSADFDRSRKKEIPRGKDFGLDLTGFGLCIFTRMREGKSG